MMFYGTRTKISADAPFFSKLASRQCLRCPVRFAPRAALCGTAGALFAVVSKFGAEHVTQGVMRLTVGA